MGKETLEEAAENSFLANKLENSTAVEKAHYIAGFRECAKWQQEGMYSKGEVDKMFETLKLYSVKNVATITNVDLFISSWKREFKKK